MLSRLNRKTASNELPAIPKIPPRDFQPCGKDKDEYCVIFIPNCEATNANDAKKMSCAYTDNQGFCNNWFRLLENTGQYQWNGESWDTKPKYPFVSNGGVKLSWDEKMAPYQCKNPYSLNC